MAVSICEHGEHDYYDGYYGTHCRNCDWFAPYGAASWDIPTEEEQARIDAEEEFYTSGTCAVCGGEWGDGWSSCICSLDMLAWDDNIA